jgi:hypothetical protein
LLTNVLEDFAVTRIIEIVIRRGDETMRVALQVNIALWGMILCAIVEAAEQFL